MSFHICHPKGFFKAAVKVFWQRGLAVKQRGSSVTSRDLMSPAISSWAGSGYLGAFPSHSTRRYRHQPVVLHEGNRLLKDQSRWGLQLVSDGVDEGSGGVSHVCSQALEVLKILAGFIPPTWFSSGLMVTPHTPFPASLCSARFVFSQPSGLTPSSSCVLPVGGTEQGIQLPQRALSPIALCSCQLAGSL